VSRPDPLLVNDVHSQLNPTRVERIVAPSSLEKLQGEIRRAGSAGQTMCIAGGRHAMGGQQFAAGTVLLDTRQLSRVLRFDGERGLVEVEAGIQWPQLIYHLVRVQEGVPEAWGIRQKQTGADRLCLGGALAANVHGRGLRMKPLIGDIESFVLVDAEGKARTCSRRENAELFRLAVGGYGLFGVVYSLTLRLSRRLKLRRVVELQDLDGLSSAFATRIRDGFLYGDFQFSIAESTPEFLRNGVFSCYQPVPPETVLEKESERASEDDWLRLVALAHQDKPRAYDLYTKAYLSSNGKLYWSDTHQLSTYADGYHAKVDTRIRARHAGTEIITEIYVPRARLAGFMDEVRADFRRNAVNLIYGTIRLIEPDEESFLAWAREPYACIIFNLHTEHTPEGKEHSAAAFRRLIDLGIRHGGSYYLTYHRYATREQVERCYPQFREFLKLKKQYDPQERFQSDWYRHYRAIFA
jgi:FAD/FMN-containing dehydrogenase